MRKETLTYPSAIQDKTIHAVVYIPEGEPQGMIQIIHGYAEHIGRYDAFMRDLAEAGYIAFGNDHAGHGLTAESEDDLTNIGAYNALYSVLEDEQQLNATMRSRFGDELPCTILGHSMGSLMLRALLFLYPNLCDKAVIMGTGDMKLGMLRVFAIILSLYSAFHKGTWRSGLISKIAIEQNNSKFKPARTPHDWLSANPENVDRYIADPLCGKRGTLYTFRFLQELMTLVRQPVHLTNMHSDLPVLFVAGEEDAFGGFGEGVKAVVGLFEEAGMDDVRLKLYPGMRHEILNEKGSDEVVEDVLTFVRG